MIGLSDDEAPEPPVPLRTLLARHFAPAISSQDLVRRSTDELWRIIERHVPGHFAHDEVHQELIAAGYRTQLVDDELLWLVRPL